MTHLHSTGTKKNAFNLISICIPFLLNNSMFHVTWSGIFNGIYTICYSYRVCLNHVKEFKIDSESRKSVQTRWNTLKHMHSSSTVPRSSLALMADPSEICVISTAPSKVRGRSCTTAASWLHVTGHASLNEALSHVPCVAYIVHSSFCLSQDHGQMFLKSSKDSHASPRSSWLLMPQRRGPV